jgi:mono/diheme cytochrome c family protein
MRFMVAILLLISTTVVVAQGKKLHDAACLQCHSSLTGGKPNSFYTRADRKVNSLASLQKRVKGCAVAADVNWTDQQRNTVVQYLADSFYKF